MYDNNLLDFTDTKNPLYQSLNKDYFDTVDDMTQSDYFNIATIFQTANLQEIP